MVSYVGRHPTGRKFYVSREKSLPAIVYVVFGRRKDEATWRRVSTVENRPYDKDLQWVDGFGFAPMNASATPSERAQNQADWWQRVANNCDGYETQIVGLEVAKKYAERLK